MIRSVKFVNFRCFGNQTVKDCKRINILVGRNSSGKTSFLEGVFLAMSNSPESVGRIRQWRGLDGGFFQGSQRYVNEALWGNLFRDDTKDLAEIIAAGDPNHTRNLKIIQSNEVLGEGMPGFNSSGIKFKWVSKGQKDFESVPLMVNGNLQFAAGPLPAAEVFFFAANHQYSSSESASRLSELSKRLALGEFIEVFKGRYPDVQDLSVELVAGLPLIHAKMKGQKRKVPLSYVSGGMNKFASMLLSFAVSPGSVVLIDEIENGLYFRDMSEIWKILLDFALRFDCQLFASTHSGECIEAASEAAASHKGEFSIIQANRGKLHQFQGEEFVWAAEENVEIR